ncbi:MAG: AraC family transcriptional regulator [Oscillospiraceae bacterium]|jgi:AraC family transcriptional regulator|nr:AraC family transcriptional regulator [Oscillospiraceae bacterium]
MEWVQGIQNAIRYIEDNLIEDLDYNKIAKQANVSSFLFQRSFNILCGFTLGEYIRNRRLTLAGMELSSENMTTNTSSKIRIIDIAIKYGYDSPDSFTKAFTRFHGIPPSLAKKEGANLKSVASLKIKFTLEGGSIMDYKIETKPAFSVIGTVKEFNSETMGSSEIPQFWSKHYESGDCKYISGQYGICYDHDSDSGNFCYMIADDAKDKGDIPDNFIKLEIETKTWAVFPVKGAMPKAIQDINNEIWSQWFPNCREYEPDGNINIEMYTCGDTDSDDYYSEVWIPVKKKD